MTYISRLKRPEVKQMNTNNLKLEKLENDAYFDMINDAEVEDGYCEY